MRWFSVLLLMGLRHPVTAQTQEPSSESRKIVRKIHPRYPEIARRMNLGGTVKVIAVVAPDGKVPSRIGQALWNGGYPQVCDLQNGRIDRNRVYGIDGRY